MKTNKFLFLALAASVLVSCNSDDDSGRAPLGDYDNGILVLNEGGLGTVTYISDDLNTVQQDIFFEVNGDSQDLGSYTQSVFFDGDRAFIISGSNKVTVVNRYTFEFIATIDTGFAAPRYGVVYNGKAYVTNSNTFESSTDDYLAVINLSTLQVESQIPVNNQAERILEENGKLYVSNGFYGSGNSITVINPATASITAVINTELAPNSFDEEDGTLYVLCAGWSGPGQLVKIDTNSDTVTATIDLPESIEGLANLDIEDDQLYFTGSGNIYKYALNATTFAADPFIQTNSTAGYIGYGFGVEDGKIFIAEVSDFVSDGSVLIYSTNGDFLREIPAGLGPNGFYFN